VLVKLSTLYSFSTMSMNAFSRFLPQLQNNHRLDGYPVWEREMSQNFL
jgi:hypothetical protein